MHFARLKFSGLFFLLCLSPLVQAAEKNKTPDRAPAQIAASPSIIETKIGTRPSNESIKLFNLGDKPVSVTVSVTNWDLDEKNEVQILPPSPQSLSQWLIINPLSFTIPAKKTQTVRLSIRPKSKPTEGEHRAMLFFHQQLPENEKSESPGMQVKFRLGIAVYGLAGDIVRQGTLHNISLHQQKETAFMDFDIESTGNANIRLDAQYSLWPTTRFPGVGNVPRYHLKKKDEPISPEIKDVGDLTTTPVLPGSRRHIHHPLRLPQEAGQYTLYIQGKLGDTPVTKVFPLSVK